MTGFESADVVLPQHLLYWSIFWHELRIRAMTEANMNLLKQVPSYLAALATVAVVALPITGAPGDWHDRINDPVVFLMALAFAGAALLLWPLGNNNQVRQ
jgi:hypothetical protein